MNKGINVQQRKRIIIAIIVIVLIIDQAIKYWVKTNMTLGESFPILGLDWANIRFIENNGMAFGIEFGGRTGKLFLSLFRIFAVSILGYYLFQLVRQNVKTSLLISFALILGGAIGNIIDSAFYGQLFSASTYSMPATFLPDGGGYESLFHGKVVDMLYFPILRGHYPDWFPFWSGQPFLFFRPIFNIADSFITTGVISIILFHRKFFITADEQNEEAANEEE